MFVRWKCVDGMFPVDVHVTSKTKQHTVCLRKIDARSVLGIQKRELTFGTERYTHSNVLSLGPSLVERCRVMMKGFPIGGVLVPVDCLYVLLFV